MTTIKVPYRISEIDVDNICYTDIKVNNKKTIVYMKYCDNNKFKNIVFQTPTFLSTNLVKCKNNMYELDVPLIGKEMNKIDKFINFLNEIDKKIMKDAKNNNKWFENFTDVKTMKYQRIIRESIDKNNDRGVIRLKILKTNDFETIIHNNNNRINVEEINKDSWLKCILEIYAIWINPNGFGLFIRPILLSLKPCTRINYNYKLIEDSDEADEDVNVDTIQDNSIFIRSENEITSSVLEMPMNTPSSEEPIETKKFDDDLNSTTSSEH